MRLVVWRRLIVDRRRHPRVGVVLRDVDADANDFLDRRTFGKVALQESAFALGVVQDGGRPAEDVPVDVEVSQGLVIAARTG